ncbi:hypothetical protein DVW08_17080 [Clostridium botulinum]|nr:hypothetical protein [Clostridium botulinum]MBN1053699.1 hypothetical protein [Clostridium botulinum]
MKIGNKKSNKTCYKFCYFF